MKHKLLRELNRTRNIMGIIEHTNPLKYEVRKYINLFNALLQSDEQRTPHEEINLPDIKQKEYIGYGKVFGIDMEVENMYRHIHNMFKKSLRNSTQDTEGNVVWNESFIEELIKKQLFKVAKSYDEFEFVGGHRVGALVNTTYDEIVAKFGPPTSAIPSGDNKVQVEWDIQFENGSRASIYDYKQYDVPYEEVTNWSVGGNSPQDAFEVYKIMDLI